MWFVGEMEIRTTEHGHILTDVHTRHGFVLVAELIEQTVQNLTVQKYGGFLQKIPIMS